MPYVSYEMTGQRLALEMLFDELPAQDGCLVWPRSCDMDGYGQVYFCGKATRVHMVSFAIFHGEVPDGKEIMHSCDNPPCFRPSHLSSGTKLDNKRDSVSKGRSRHLSGELNPNSKLTGEVVREIRAQKLGGLSNREIARRHGVACSLVSLIVNRQLWKTV